MCALGVFGFSACDDIDDFTTSPNNLLTFSTDTVRLDTCSLPCRRPTARLWVSNRSGKDCAARRCASKVATRTDSA